MGPVPGVAREDALKGDNSAGSSALVLLRSGVTRSLPFLLGESKTGGQGETHDVQSLIRGHTVTGAGTCLAQTWQQGSYGLLGNVRPIEGGECVVEILSECAQESPGAYVVVGTRQRV